MDFEGADGSSMFMDVGYGSSTWIPSGANTTISTANILVGTSSLRIDGSSDYLRSAGLLLPATGNWEISATVYMTGAASKDVFSVADAAYTPAGSQIEVFVSQANGSGSSSNKIGVYLSNGTTFDLIAETTSVVSQAASHTLVINRVGNTVSISVDGSNTGSGTFTGSLNQPSGRDFRIGKAEASGANGPTLLFVDALRITTA
jgi:uncharacterized protein (UPF0333 family)